MAIQSANTVPSPAFFTLPAGIIFLLALSGVKPTIFLTSGFFACLLMLMVKSGMEFSEDNRARRQYYSLFGLRVGRWQPLPVIVGVTMKYFSEMRLPNGGNRNWGVWKDTARRDEKLVIMLSVANQPVGMVLGYFQLPEMEEALAFAQNTAEKFDVPLHTYLPAGLA